MLMSLGAIDDAMRRRRALKQRRGEQNRQQEEGSWLQGYRLEEARADTRPTLPQ